jgi:hypothetical protein
MNKLIGLLSGVLGSLLISAQVLAAPTDTMRQAAAGAAAQSLVNACAAVRPFYWEIGDASARLASGSVDGGKAGPVYTASTEMPIASASKWIYSAYVVQKRGGVLDDQDVKHLSFRSGYTSLFVCAQRQTVKSCLNFLNNGEYTPANDGKFYYNGGHMQKHAVLEGLGPLRNAGLASEIRSQIGTDIELSYERPQPAGGVVTTPNDYTRFLRKLMNGDLLLGGLLGTHAVCTNPLTCPGVAVSTPIPSDETWHYSLGHWVEDDPVVGDGAFSSAGLYGFYPWIDASKRYYGVLAREAKNGALASIDCGRLIRKAWLGGIVGT